MIALRNDLMGRCRAAATALALASIVVGAREGQLARAADTAAAVSPDVLGALASRPLTTLAGSRVDAGDLHGKVVVVNFWASWCRPCRKELPALDALNSQIASRGGTVLAISIDRDASKARRFVQEQHLQLPVIQDGPDGIAKKLDLPFLPCSYVLGRDGHVAFVTRGGGEGDLAELRSAVQQQLAGGAAAMAGMEGTTQ